MEKVIISETIKYESPAVEKSELLRFLKVDLENDGFNKISTNKWQREKKNFCEVIYVQSGRYVKGEYDIFVGIILRDIDFPYLSEGHFTYCIPNYKTTKEEIVLRIKDFFETWSNKAKLAQYAKQRREAWENLSNFSGDELKLKKKEFYSIYQIAITNTDIIDYILSKDFLDKS